MIGPVDVQRRLAFVCVGTSTVRGQPSGTKKSIRDYLAVMNLGALARITGQEFAHFLDQHTMALQRVMPSHSWGIARKCLNIFLMEASMNRFLAEAYHTTDAVPFLELPLDNPNAKRLWEQAPLLRRCWTTIQTLTPEHSRKFQEQAQALAQEKGCARGYLDILWWNAE